MNIAGTTGTGLTDALALVSGTQTQNQSAGVDTDGNGGSGVHGVGHHHHGHGLRHALSQTLDQLGLSPSDDASSGQGTSGPGGSQDARQALHAFVNDLFQAAAQGGTSQTGAANAGTDGNGYGANLKTNLENLVQGVALGSASGATVDQLNNDFQNLVQAANGGTGSEATSPTLASFLQTFVQNLGGASSNNPAGTLVSTAA